MVVDAVPICFTSSKSYWNTFKQGKCATNGDFFIVLHNHDCREVTSVTDNCHT